MAVPPLDRKYLARIRKGLNRAYRDARVETLDPEHDRIVVFSDHHKGAGDKADDFRRCEHAYATALGFYLEQGFRLFVLGDAEELWEETPEKVIERYPYVLSLEAEFRTRGAGLERFWGNHDDLWSHRDAVEEHLQAPLGGPLEVREGLRMRVPRSGRGDVTLFFVHGHQGTGASDRFGGLARLPIRHLWRPFQRITGFSATTPASGHAMRGKHDRAMFEWASGRLPELVLFAGHTHRPVFAGSTPDPPATRPVAELRTALEAAREANEEHAAAALRAELEHVLAAERRPDEAVTVSPPCYFNAGCCSFPDGDITGIEIAGGEIRLVRWPANVREMLPKSGGSLDPEKRILARESLEAVLDAVTRPVPKPAIEEHPVRPPR